VVKRRAVSYGIGDPETGPCFTEPSQIDKTMIDTVKDNDKILVTYASNTIIYLKSGEHYGSLKVYESKFGSNGNPCVLIKKGLVLEKLKDYVKQKLRKQVHFFAKDDSDYLGCFVETVLNENGDRAVSAKVNGKEMMLTIKELSDHTGIIFAILKAKPIKKSDRNDEYVWGFVITELCINPLPENYEGYFVKHSKPSFKFLNKM
jgi:hypothetical protein